MSKPNDQKLSTAGGQSLAQNPFAALGGLSLPPAPGKASGTPGAAAAPGTPGAAKSGAAAAPAGPAVDKTAKNRGRVDILRSTAGRGGKTVTIVQGFVGIGLPEKEQLAKKMQRACGCGGTVKEGRIEVQGDKRDEVAKILAEAGFRPVFAGG